MKVGVLVAMEKEYQLLQNLKDDHNVTVRKTGIGKVNAAINTTQLIHDIHPDIIISTGCAGGTTPKLNVMDVVVSQSVAYHDVYCCIEGEQMGQIQGMPRFFTTPHDIVKTALRLKYDGTIHAGLIASGDWFVDSPDKLKEITSLYPDALAIDMESAAIAQTCHIFNIPFVSFRVISDVPTKHDSLNDYDNFWGTVSQNSFHIVQDFIRNLDNRES
ncbi:MAG: 5'-methylthioadenosine/S-adenosylhomocysteine nucleosidase [Prevotellaceae bacterium]|nr:5'-methylthioadenosine/S-adenosylhomocysteine nucleosidase [Candidatus Colivivens equi]